MPPSPQQEQQNSNASGCCSGLRSEAQTTRNGMMKSKADRSEPSSHRSRRSSTGPGPSVLSSRSSISKRGSFALRLLRVAAPSTRSSCRASHRRRHLLSSSGEMHGHASSHGSTLVYFISCWDASGRSTAMVQRARGTQTKGRTPYASPGSRGTHACRDAHALCSVTQKDTCEASHRPVAREHNGDRRCARVACVSVPCTAGLREEQSSSIA